MSDLESTQNASADNAPAPDVSAPTENAAPATQSVETAKTESVETAKTESTKSDLPAKFQKPDGSADIDKMTKAYLSLEKKFGSKPNLPAASIEEYEWTAPENAVDLSPDKVKEFQELALSKGFTKDQYQFIMDSHNNLMNGMLDTIGWSTEKSTENLKKSWGGEYDTQLKTAQAVFSEFAPSDADPYDPVWNHPSVMKLLARMGAEMGEDSLTNNGSAQVGVSIADQIAELRKDPKWFTDNKIQSQLTALYEKQAKQSR